jgi:hypothetical protein
MTAPHGNHLEQRLTELFQQRASTVTRARPLNFGPSEGPRRATGPKQVRLGRRRQNLGVLAAAAAVLVAIAATFLGIQANRQQPAPPLATGSHPVTTPTASPAGTQADKACQAPASWRQAITDGAFGVDRSLNTVISANGGTGDYLVMQGNQPSDDSPRIYSDPELALFHGSKGDNIYTPARSNDFVLADPTGAISADWVAFAVAHPQTPDFTYRVMLYQRGTATLRTLVEVTEKQYTQGKAIHGAPVIAAGKVYWLTMVPNKPETTTLDSWDLARGSAASTVPAANAAGLVSYGSGVALLRTVSKWAVLSNGAGAPLPKALLDATASGGNFAFDGARKLSWLRYDNGSIAYSDLIVGGDEVHSESLVRRSAGIRPAIYPFVEIMIDVSELHGGNSALLDLRANRAVALPAGVEFQAVVGDSVVFGTGITKLGAAGLSIVALSALPPVSC